MSWSTVMLACFVQAAGLQGVPPDILMAIHRVEGGRAGLEVHNSDGSRDLGSMQVNTVHLAPLAAVYGVPRSEIEARLRDDECFNVHVAAWRLSLRIKARGGNLWAGIGDYHSVSPLNHDAYRARIHRALASLKQEGWIDWLARSKDR